MKRTPERIFIRKYCEVPIIFQDADSGRYFNAVMHNCSVDGMYLESDICLPPGKEISVKLRKQLLGTYRRDNHQNVRMKVIWCKEKKVLGRTSYGFGVQRIMHDLIPEDATKSEIQAWH